MTLDTLINVGLWLTAVFVSLLLLRALAWILQPKGGKVWILRRNR
jgi:hypothetical protein